jgi:hypothetical protein
MVFALAQLAVVALVVGLLVVGGWVFWNALRSDASASVGRGVLPPRARAELAGAIAQARWQPAHDEVDGVTRVLETFPAADPAWEARFTEAMAKARYRCAYLNAEESQ